MGKVFVGSRVSRLDTGTPPERVSRVTLAVDGDNVYTAGDDTGRTVEKRLPWATQAMAESVLRRLQGVTYLPFSGEDALLDPAAEIGDGVTAGGVYSVLAKADVTFDGLYSADIAAPGGDEVEDEYPYKSRAQRQSERELARIRSSITKTAERITLLVENEVEGLEGKLELTASSLTSEIKNTRDGLNSKIEQTASSLTSEIKNTRDGLNSKIEQTASSLTTQINNTQSGLNSKIEQTAASIQTQINGLNNAYSSISQTVDSISLGVFNGRESSTIALYMNGIAIQSEEISFSGMVTFNDLSGDRGTVIDGGAIDTNTLRLNSLYGNYIYINDARGREAGMISATGSSSYDGQKMKFSSGAIEITATPGDLYLSGGGAYYATLQLGNGHAAIGGDCIPNSSGRYSCGSSAFPWSDVYADNDAIVTSDLTKKRDVSDDLSAYDRFFDALRPIRYRLENGKSGRVHLGLGAQDVERALEEAGLDGMDFGGFVKSSREDGGFDHALRYGEFIPLCIARIQELTARVAKLEGRFTS